MKYLTGVLALVALQVCTASGQRACVCARNFVPVCGTDGVTYSNECGLKCAAYKQHKEISLASEGPCTTGVQIAEPCSCTDELHEVCGSDGNTYPNSCSLNCATAKDNTLSIKHPGKCETVQVVELPTQPPCLCLSREYDPVCGSNGQTYTNPCFLNCATVHDNTLSIEHQGACETVQAPTPSPCTCTRNLKPVCGSDGKTYNNECLLNCATVHDNTLSIEHQGACETVQAPTPSPCTCTRNLKPVCGSDGKTYNNECLLNCAKENDNTLSISHREQCGAVNVVN